MRSSTHGGAAGRAGVRGAPAVLAARPGAAGTRLPRSRAKAMQDLLQALVDRLDVSIERQAGPSPLLALLTDCDDVHAAARAAAAPGLLNRAQSAFPLRRRRPQHAAVGMGAADWRRGSRRRRCWAHRRRTRRWRHWRRRRPASGWRRPTSRPSSATPATIPMTPRPPSAGASGPRLPRELRIRVAGFARGPHTSQPAAPREAAAGGGAQVAARGGVSPQDGDGNFGLAGRGADADADDAAASPDTPDTVDAPMTPAAAGRATVRRRWRRRRWRWRRRWALCRPLPRMARASRPARRRRRARPPRPPRRRRRVSPWTRRSSRSSVNGSSSGGAAAAATATTSAAAERRQGWRRPRP